MTQRIFDEFSGLVLSVPAAYSTRQATLMPMSAERSLDMNGGDGPPDLGAQGPNAVHPSPVPPRSAVGVQRARGVAEAPARGALPPVSAPQLHRSRYPGIP